jgi:hypothetical protein
MVIIIHTYILGRTFTCHIAIKVVLGSLHNPVIPPQLGADDIENTASSIVACWTVFTELLPGNALIKSVTIF